MPVVPYCSDMFDEVLKFGALIVDELRRYAQPIIVYLPPKAELRGGAWVVVDSSINPSFMEMYAAPDSRGGVLEPAGVVSIKFKKQRLHALASRLDSQLQASSSVSMASPKQQEERLKKLEPVYVQVATEFADLHDRPYRMLSTGVINGIIDWKRARHFLYWRFRRRSLECHLQKVLRESIVITTI